ncbi:hypothetical protein SCOR_02000 [Sulfidibacter corallicola]
MRCRPGILLGLAIFMSVCTTETEDGSAASSVSATNLAYAFDFNALETLTPFTAFDPLIHCQSEFTVILYFSELSCTTCTDESLVYLAEWHEALADKVDFLLVVQGQDPLYLNNLRRLGRVKYPILLESEPGMLGLPETAVLLVRKGASEPVWGFHPVPGGENQRHAERFLARLHELI